MNDIPLRSGNLPQKWLDKWQTESPVPLIKTWEDPENMYDPIPRKEEITEKNHQMLEKALYIIRHTQKNL